MRRSEDFSETEYDFTRCVRPNGTAYGTGGKCRKGTEAEALSPAELSTPPRQATQTDINLARKAFKDYDDRVKAIQEHLKRNPEFAKDPKVQANLNTAIKNRDAAKEALEQMKPTAKQKTRGPLRGTRQWVNERELASEGKMSRDTATSFRTGMEVDFYRKGTGDKTQGVVQRNDGRTVSIKEHKDGRVASGKVHKFDIVD